VVSYTWRLTRWSILPFWQQDICILTDLFELRTNSKRLRVNWCVAFSGAWKEFDGCTSLPDHFCCRYFIVYKQRCHFVWISIYFARKLRDAILAVLQNWSPSDSSFDCRACVTHNTARITIFHCVYSLELLTVSRCDKVGQFLWIFCYRTFTYNCALLSH